MIEIKAKSGKSKLIELIMSENIPVGLLTFGRDLPFAYEYHYNVDAIPGGVSVAKGYILEALEEINIHLLYFIVYINADEYFTNCVKIAITKIEPEHKEDVDYFVFAHK